MAGGNGIVVVTGSSGYVGTALIERLAKQFTIVGLDRPDPPVPPTPAHSLAVNLESDASVHHALEEVRARFGNRVASVIHLAAFYDFSGDPSPKYQSVNVLGTERLLKALQRFEVEQFVYASTILVHAPTEPGQPINERSPLKPAWEYPKSKLDAEIAVAKHHGSAPYLILRLAGLYDESCRLPALAQQIQRIYERKLLSHVFPGDGKRGQASMHLHDAVELFARAIEKRGDLPAELTLLAGEPGLPPGYEQLQRELGQLIHGEPWDTREIPKALAKAGAWLEEVALPESEEPFIKSWMIDLADDHYELDITRTRQLLGWEPRYRLLNALPDIVRRLKTDPIAFYNANKLEVPRDLAAHRPSPRSAERHPPPPPGRG